MILYFFFQQHSTAATADLTISDYEQAELEISDYEV
jgi:hypothetical protein